jgi:hypothetical protein
LAKPWNRRRALDIFRDETDLSINPEGLEKIFQVLDQSRHFLLLASPGAASSPWVRREVEHWVSAQGTKSLLIIVTGGELLWNDKSRDFDWDRTDALPECLRGHFPCEPLWVDFRWAKHEQNLTLTDERFSDAVATVAAELHGMSKRDLVGEDLRQHRNFLRAKRIVTVGSAILVTGILLASYLAIRQSQSAELAKERAKNSQWSQEVAATAIDLAAGGNVAGARHAARNAVQIAGTEKEAVNALRQTLLIERAFNLENGSARARYALVGYGKTVVTIDEEKLDRDKESIGVWAPCYGDSGPSSDYHLTYSYLIHGQFSGLSTSPKTGLIAASGPGDNVRTFDGQVGGEDCNQSAQHGLRTLYSFSDAAGFRARTVALSPDGTRIGAGYENGEFGVWDTSTHALIFQGKQPGDPIELLRFSPNGQLLVTVATDKQGMTYAVVSLIATGKTYGGASLQGEHIRTIAMSPSGALLLGCDNRPGGLSQYGEKLPDRQGYLVKNVAPRIDTADKYEFFTRQPSGITASGFSSDGRYLFTADGDGKVLVWDMQNTGQQSQLKGDDRFILTLSGDKASIQTSILTLSFSDDGKMMGTFSKDHWMVIRNVEPALFKARAGELLRIVDQ